jgi:hypothetical protein
VSSSTLRPYYDPGKDPVPIVQETGCAPGPVWTGAENLAHTGVRSPDRPARNSVAIPTELPGPPRIEVVPKITSQSLLSTDYPVRGHICLLTVMLSSEATSVVTDVVTNVQVIRFILYCGYTELCNCVLHSGKQTR